VELNSSAITTIFNCY